MDVGLRALSANFRRKGRRPPTTDGIRQLKWLPFLVVSKIPQCLALCDHNITIHQRHRQTDGRSDVMLMA